MEQPHYFLVLAMDSYFYIDLGCPGMGHLSLGLLAFILGLGALQNAFLCGRAGGEQILPKI